VYFYPFYVLKYFHIFIDFIWFNILEFSSWIDLAKKSIQQNPGKGSILCMNAPHVWIQTLNPTTTQHPLALTSPPLTPTSYDYENDINRCVVRLIWSLSAVSLDQTKGKLVTPTCAPGTCISLWLPLTHHCIIRHCLAAIFEGCSLRKMFWRWVYLCFVVVTASGIFLKSFTCCLITSSSHLYPAMGVTYVPHFLQVSICVSHTVGQVIWVFMFYFH
jgi:hypothetical protein